MGYEEIARANHGNGNNCSVSLFRAFADKLGISEEEAAKIAPAPRSEGGKCGGYLAGRKLIEMIKPEAVEEFDNRFLEQNGDDKCANLIKSRRLQGKNCNDLVGETADIIESMLVY
ncbi:MAG: C-GCAxxG-C-C family protein [Lachnospiraceae bacterium]|nr:C-GCAxxG-C-C family protein [Lachnospiraceae bacterium]